MTTTSNIVPIVNQAFLYINGFMVSNNATTPNTKIDISFGQCRDSQDVMDIESDATITINAAVSGANGIDTGTFAASKAYYVHVCADVTGYQPVMAMISLSRTAPTLPFGYTSFRWVATMFSDASVHFLLGYNAGNNNARSFVYDAPRATSVTAGTSATYAAIALTQLVPTVDLLPVTFKADWTANAAGNTFNMSAGAGVGDQWSMIAPVAGGTAHTVGFGKVLSQLVAGVPTVQYKVSAVGGVAITIASFEYFI